MGNLRRVSSALVMVVAAAACGDDGASNPDALVIIDAANPDAPNPDAPPPIDAPNYDFSCYQNQAPTPAATVTISGTVQEFSGTSIAPAMGATVVTCTGDCQGANNLGSVGPTTVNGQFTTAPITTNGTAVEGYLRITKAGQWATYMYPDAPLAANVAGIPVLLLNNLIVSNLHLLITDEPQAAGNGLLAVAVTDCSTPPMGIDDATVTVTQNGVPVDDEPVGAGAASPQAAGAFLVTNVPPGDTTVTATYNGMTFRTHVVRSYADALTITQVKPGF